MDDTSTPLGAVADDAEPLPPLEAAAIEEKAAERIPGAEAHSPLDLGWPAWKAVLKRVWVMIGFHNLSLLGAGMALYGFLAFIPLIASIVMVYGLVGDPQTVANQMNTIVQLVPSEAATLIREQMEAIVTSNAGTTGLALALALLFAIWSSTRATSGMIQALNVIYEERETRNILKLTGLSILLTLAIVALALVGVASATVFGVMQRFGEQWLGPVTAPIIKLLTWAVAIGVGASVFAILYRYAPDRRNAQWRWLYPGALIGTALWALASLLFSLYVQYISDYNATYGALSAIAVFVMWLFLSSQAILLGAVFNAELERQTARDSTVGHPRPIGRRGAVMADNTLLDHASAELAAKKAARKARHVAQAATPEGKLG